MAHITETTSHVTVVSSEPRYVMSLQPVSVEAKATVWDVFGIPTNASLSILHADCATHITFNINYSTAINMLYPYASTDHYATCLRNTTALHLLFRRFIRKPGARSTFGILPPPLLKKQQRTKNGGNVVALVVTFS